MKISTQNTSFKKTKIIFFTLLVSIFITSTIIVNAQVFYTTGWMVKQEKSNWCWAAVDQMMASTRTSDVRSQTEIVNYTFNTSDAPNYTATIGQLAAGATYAAKNTTSFQAYYQTFPGSTIQTIINANWTIGAGAYNLSGGHAFAIVGYDSNTDEVLLFDPQPGNSNLWITVDDFFNDGATPNAFRWRESAW